MDHIAVGPTNEELDERQAKAAKEGKLPRVQVLRDGTGPKKLTARDPDKQIQEREDFRSKVIDEGAYEDVMLAPDPMHEVAAPYLEPGMAYGFLSSACVKSRGMRGYQVVKDAQGNPVTMGTLTLGKIPQRIKDAREKHQREESESQVKSLAVEYEQKVSQVKRTARDLGLAVVDPGEVQGDPRGGQRLNIG